MVNAKHNLKLSFYLYLNESILILPDHLLSLLTQRIISIESEMKAMRSSTAALYELYARALGDGTSQRVEEMSLDVCGTMEELLSLDEKMKEETFRNRVVC
jgi:hypothetical protein